MCATGSEALRNAAYAVASGAYDLVMAIGVEKLKDSGYSGLVGSRPPNDGTAPTMTAPATFSLLAPAYAKKYGVDEATLKEVLSRIAWKNHKNGAKNPKAQFRKEVPIETISASPTVAGMLGIIDCSGVTDGSAAAIVVPRRGRAQVHQAPDLRQGALVRRRARPRATSARTTTSRPSPRWWRSSKDAYKQAGVTDPRERDQHGRGARLLHADRARADGGHGLLAARQAWKDVLDGRFDLDGRAAGQSRRRAQELRPPDRRQRACA